LTAFLFPSRDLFAVYFCAFIPVVSKVRVVQIAMRCKLVP